jgi:hypothetical protein
MAADTALQALVSGRVYSYLAPTGTLFPFVSYNFQGGADVMAVGAIRVMNAGMYQIKAITEASGMATAEPIANRIDALFHHTTGTVTGGIILACHREQPIAYVENTNGLRRNHVGGLYRIYIQSSP